MNAFSLSLSAVKQRQNLKNIPCCYRLACDDVGLCIAVFFPFVLCAHVLNMVCVAAGRTVWPVHTQFIPQVVYMNVKYEPLSVCRV